ncbi:helix-turn-helix domain-containing protein [Aquimarina sp. 2201CG1-2-11]|uniref:helix-turn-helix domain-containing protein n=1 Tax=Aquimarina discodermiae TaxID=3231043 RepID=UPI0034622B0A
MNTLKATFFFILIGIFCSNSQNTVPPDSILQKNYTELGDSFFAVESDTTKAIMYANAYFLKALRENDTLRMFDGKYLLARINDNLNIYLSFCDSLIEATQKTPTKKYPTAIFLEKGIYLYRNNKTNEASKEFFKANTVLKKFKNDSLQHITYIYLGYFNHYIGKYKKALHFEKKAYKFAVDNNYYFYKGDTLKAGPFLGILLDITNTYRKSHQIDSAYFYNKKAINLYQALNDNVLLGYTFYTKGLIEYEEKLYKKSIKSLKKAVKTAKEDDNFRLLNKIYSILSSSYQVLNDDKNAFLFSKKADSLYEARNIYSNNIENCFIYLVDYYKKANDLNNQLKYINKLLNIKELKLTEKNKVSETLIEKYDIPNLLAEKKEVIAKLEEKVQISRRSKTIYILLITLFIGLLGYQIHKKRNYKKRFLNIINQEKIVAPKSVVTIPKESKNISNDVVNDILNKLDNFEKKHGYTNTNINLQSLAQKLGTNSNYLSKVINQHKNNSFSKYINQLRIEYIVNQLKKDSVLRKYSIKAIAGEAGFKNAESFSKAFYKHTELKPSYFIKELEKFEVN